MKFPVNQKFYRLRMFNLLMTPVLVILCGFAVLGDGGLLHGYGARLRLSTLQNEVNIIETQNEMIRKHIYLVQYNPRTAQQLIAQTSLWAHPETTVYRFESYPDSKLEGKERPNRYEQIINLFKELINTE
jgi:hypothetical protein